jgi:hypothetical protein
MSAARDNLLALDDDGRVVLRAHLHHLFSPGVGNYTLRVKVGLTFQIRSIRVGTVRIVAPTGNIVWQLLQLRYY